MPRTQAARTDATRKKILGAAFLEVYRRGFQGASINDIVAAAGTTKGALFHHFAGKQALGYALLDEVIAPILTERWLAPLAETDDPLSVLQHSFRHWIEDDIATGNLVHGCPMNNLAQEMSSLDEGFRARLDRLYASWRDVVAAALARGQRAGTVRRDVDVTGASTLVVFSQIGIWGTGKYSQDPQLMTQAGEAFCGYLDTLRGSPFPPPAGRAGTHQRRRPR